MNGLFCKVGVVQRVLSLPQRNYLKSFVGGCCKLGVGLVLPETLPFLFGRKRNEEYSWRQQSIFVSRDYCVDFFSQFNLGAAIVGSSGSGKSTLAKRLVFELTNAGSPVVVLDPHSEFSGVVRACGGRSFDARKISLALFELDGVSPGEKSIELAALLKKVLLLGDVQAYYLGKSIRGAYSDRGFLEGDRSSWQRRPPSLQDVVEHCEKLVSSSRDASLLSLRRRLELLSSCGVFSSKTQVPFSVIISQTTCFDLKNLRSAEAQALFAEVFLRKLYSFMQSRESCASVFALVDEAQKLCVGTPESPSFVGALLREARKFKLGTIVVSQSIKALDPAIASNCACNFVFLTREPDDAHYASALLCGSKYADKTRLVESELNSLGQFECLVSTSTDRDVARVRVTPLWEDGVKEIEGKELPFIEGSFKQKTFFEELRKLLPNEKIVYSDRSVIPPFEIDVTLPERKVAIEYDGVFYHSSEEQKKRDEEKEKLLAEKGWKLIRVLDDGLSLEQVREKAREIALGEGFV